MPDTECRETEEHEQAFWRYLVGTALLHTPEVDSRYGTFLSKLGFTGSASAINISDVTKQAILDPDDPNRVACGPGPLIWVQESSATRTISNATDMLLSESFEFRKAAIEHLQHLSETSRVLTPHSKLLLDQKTAAALSFNPMESRDAAENIFDAVSDDFLCNLAAFRQSLRMRHEEGTSAYSKTVFLPSLSSLASIDEAICRVTGQQQAVKEKINSCVADATLLPEALKKYFDLCGHLALAGELSAGQVVQDWIAKNQDESNTWDSVWNWANACGSPYAQYHACQVFATLPALIPEPKREEYWRAIAKVVVMNTTADAASGSSEAWLIRCALARHYCQHLECLNPIGDSEAISSFSWWLAEQTASVFGHDEQSLAHVRKGPVAHFANESQLLWDSVHPWTTPSPMRFATHQINTLWGMALACQLKPVIETSPADSIPLDLVDKISWALTGYIVTTYPGGPAAQAATFAFQLPLFDVVEAWLSLPEKVSSKPKEEPTSETGEAGTPANGAATSEMQPTPAQHLQLFAELGPIVSDPVNLGENLDRLAGANEADGMLLAGQLRAAVYKGLLDVELFWGKLSSREWRDRVMQELAERPLYLLVDAIADLQYRLDHEKRCEIPHFFAEAAEKSQEKSERERLLFSFTVLMSVYTDTTSALQRLLLGKHKKRFAPHVEDWHQRLEDIRKASPGWVAARMRPVLAVLH